jgi:hypothetical protein
MKRLEPRNRWEVTAQGRIKPEAPARAEPRPTCPCLYPDPQQDNLLCI